jgi:hypothetical protein
MFRPLRLKLASKPLHASQRHPGRFLAHSECTFWHLPLRGTASLSGFRRFATGFAALPARWCKKRRRAFGPPASMLACQMPIRRLVECRFAATLFVPAHFCPQNAVGGKNGRLSLSGSGFAALVFIPLRPHRGTGEKGKKGIAGFRDRSRRSLISQHCAMFYLAKFWQIAGTIPESYWLESPPPALMPPRRRQHLRSGHGQTRHNAAGDR